MEKIKNEIILDEEKKSSARPWEILADFIVNKDYGDVITHGEITEVINVEREDNQYRYILQKAKKRALVAGKMIESMKNIGYRIVMPDNYSEATVNQFNRGFKCFDKGVTISQHAPKDKMSNEALVRHRSVNDRALNIYAAVKGSCVELETLSKRELFEPEQVGRK